MARHRRPVATHVEWSQGAVVGLGLTAWATAVLLLAEVTVWPFPRCILVGLVLGLLAAGAIAVFPEGKETSWPHPATTTHRRNASNG
jgi:hypothetical protein